jgi:hypothetical protein
LSFLELQDLWRNFLHRPPIPHLVEMVVELRAAPGVHLAIQWCPVSLQTPPPYVFWVSQFCPVEQVVVLQPIQGADPPNLTLGEVDELPPPARDPPGSLYSASRMVDRHERAATSIAAILRI